MKAGDYIKGYELMKEHVKGYGNKLNFLWRINEISNGTIIGKSIVLKDSRNVIKEQVSEGFEFRKIVSVSHVEKLISKGQAEIITE